MATKTVSEKLSKVSDAFTVNMYDNGFMVEISGRNKKEDWVTSKTICNTLDDLITVIKSITDMERE